MGRADRERLCTYDAHHAIRQTHSNSVKDFLNSVKTSANGRKENASFTIGH